MRRFIVLTLATVLALMLMKGIEAAPMPSPVPLPGAIGNFRRVGGGGGGGGAVTGNAVPRAEATPAPRWLPPNSTPNEVQAFFAPMQQWARNKGERGDRSLQPDPRAWPREVREAKKLAAIVGRAGSVNRAERIALERSVEGRSFDQSRLAQLEERQLAREEKRAMKEATKRSDIPSVPLSEMPYPTFPAQYPSCYNCQSNYSSISSCAAASSVFENATNIFNDPFAYISVIKCACTDTFQAAFPQCVECFQLTDQCQYLGTDPQGTGAPEAVTNIRSICALGSSILGGAQSANYPDYNNTYTPSTVPGYTDVTTTGEGYYDESTGAIFGGAIQSKSPAAALPLVMAALCVGLGIFTLI